MQGVETINNQKQYVIRHYTPCMYPGYVWCLNEKTILLVKEMLDKGMIEVTEWKDK